MPRKHLDNGCALLTRAGWPVLAAALVVSCARVGPASSLDRAAPRPLLPIPFEHSAEFRWLSKRVLASRAIDALTDSSQWRFTGTGRLTFPSAPRLGNVRVLRVEMQMFREQPAPTRNRLSAVNLRRVFNGEDWSGYNRVSM